jgi:hypothetical protein
VEVVREVLNAVHIPRHTAENGTRKLHDGMQLSFLKGSDESVDSESARAQDYAGEESQLRRVQNRSLIVADQRSCAS